MARQPSLPTPKFGATVTNLVASKDNPHRTGYFVRAGHATGRMNPGPWWEITDGRGAFWQLNPTIGRHADILGDQPHLVVDRVTELPQPPTEDGPQ